MQTKLAELLFKIRTKTLKQICKVFATTYPPTVKKIKDHLGCDLRTAYDYYYACIFLNNCYEERLDWRIVQQTKTKPKPTFKKTKKRDVEDERTLEILEETNEEFAERFTPTLWSHLSRVIMKDFPVIVTYMSEDHNCEKCVMRGACDMFLELYVFTLPQLPICMKERIGIPNTIRRLEDARSKSTDTAYLRKCFDGLSP